METGFGRNLLAELLDSVGRGVLLMALGIGWFVFLWGLNLPALLAGIALGTLLLLLRRLYRQTTLVRRETALRCRIGGELLLEKMLLSEAKEAHFQAALLLEEKWPLRLPRSHRLVIPLLTLRTSLPQSAFCEPERVILPTGSRSPTPS